MLGEISSARFAELAADAETVVTVRELADDLAAYLGEPRWYQTEREDDPNLPEAVAYFSMEFGVSEVLPNYSGGLGVLAGDHLKAASDLGVPLVAVGLLYRSGYFRQSLALDGWQVETYPVLDPQGLPLHLLTDESGAADAGHGATCPAAACSTRGSGGPAVGRVPLLLLDSDIEENDADLRGVTDRLYGGDQDHRIRQEILVGIGGVRAVRAFCAASGHPAPEVFHTNEGHAGYLGLERIRELQDAEGLDFDEALAVVRAGTVFTTHTPVPAGIDRFPLDMVRHYFDDSAKAHALLPGVADRPRARARRRGQPEHVQHGPHGPAAGPARERRLEAARRGVAGHVRRPVERLRHRRGADRLGDQRRARPDLGGPRGRPRCIGPPAPHPAAPRRATAPSDALLWDLRTSLRARLVGEVRRRVREAWLQRGASVPELSWTDHVFDPDVLTVGFARRVPTYKRLTLMLRDPDRLRDMLLDPHRPVQLVVAGKAHPADDGGKALIQQIVRFADDPAVRHRIVFLPDYDMSMARYLYWGCDVWLNNPLRPLEACGTSGMKSALNGGLNLSIRDGWWDELYDGANGWAIPTADGVDDPHRRDDLEANALYELLATQVAPAFYDRDATACRTGGWSWCATR